MLKSGFFLCLFFFLGCDETTSFRSRPKAFIPTRASTHRTTRSWSQPQDLQSTGEGFKPVYFDIAINGEASGRFVFKLYDDTPKTSANFFHLCVGDKTTCDGGSDKLHYANSIFHRIIPDFMVQGGDITAGNGTGGISIYGRSFPDENFIHSHDGPYLLSMANKGPHTNGSQFFITLAETPWLDGRHTVFGKLIQGKELLRHMTKFGSPTGSVAADIRITASGVL